MIVTYDLWGLGFFDFCMVSWRGGVDCAGGMGVLSWRMVMALRSGWDEHVRRYGMALYSLTDRYLTSHLTI